MTFGSRINSGSAVLGSLNIAGVRLTIRQGRVEGTTNDIDAGTVTLAKSSSLPAGGQLEAASIAKPVFVLEPSGRYQARRYEPRRRYCRQHSARAARAKVLVDNNAAQLNELNAVVMDGTLTGNAVVAFNSRAGPRSMPTFLGRSGQVCSGPKRASDPA